MHPRYFRLPGWRHSNRRTRSSCHWTASPSTRWRSTSWGDTASADTIFYNLPAFEGEVPDGWGTGVWSWDHPGIMGSGANTVAELVAEIPGLIVLAAGDYGTPSVISAFGSGGGGVRVFRDGFELFPLEGGVVDLARVGLAGIRRVRLERGMRELRLDMWSLDYDDGRPYSLVEAGTGDLGTNIFRGAFTDPTALGGSVGLGLERVDTSGPGGQENGNRTGSWLRYQVHRGDDAGLALDFRSMGTESDLPDYASPITRTDWALRGRMRLAEGVVGEAYTGKSSHDVEDVRETYELEGGSRSQRGLRIGLSRSGLWARGEYRRFGGDDLPASRIDLTGGASRPGVGGISADLARGSWADNSTSSKRVRAWAEPLLGVVSLFGSWESGTYGSRTTPLLEAVPPLDSTAVDGTELPEAEEDVTTAPPLRNHGPARHETRCSIVLAWCFRVRCGARGRVGLADPARNRAGPGFTVLGGRPADGVGTVGQAPNILGKPAPGGLAAAVGRARAVPAGTDLQGCARLPPCLSGVRQLRALVEDRRAREQPDERSHIR